MCTKELFSDISNDYQPGPTGPAEASIHNDFVRITFIRKAELQVQKLDFNDPCGPLLTQDILRFYIICSPI